MSMRKSRSPDEIERVNAIGSKMMPGVKLRTVNRDAELRTKQTPAKASE